MKTLVVLLVSIISTFAFFTSTAFADTQFQRISPAQAVQESLQPGAVTEGASPLSRITGASMMTTSAPQVCYHTGVPGLTVTWGSWPYQQVVHEQRDWCGTLNGAQSWRSSYVSLGSYLCNNSNPRQVKTGGGNGYFYTDVESIGHFDCPTNVPYITPHPDDYMVWRCNMAGYCPLLATGRL